MDPENNLRFEFLKKFNYHFLPMYGPDITIEQATQLSKCGGSCGGPYYPVRQSSTRASMKFEQEAKRVADKLKADFTIINQLPPHSPWWKKNKVYLRYLEFVADSKRRKYGIKRKPALVVSVNDKYITLYDWEELEKKVNDFVVKSMVT